VEVVALAHDRGVGVGRPAAPALAYGASLDTRDNSPEFIGKARAFIARIGAVAAAAYPLRVAIVTKAIRSAEERYLVDVKAALGGRTRRGRPLRPELLIELVL
jgi:hypothetical protein